ncbi:uncharacterized protein PRCAT00003479001 [Priceomyces carsonii]|uniref:uncharacterized protein n=1 Tax=Priceomyces carsonii TaxID=28549 RepID=UPI002ED9CED5|nr:unnamed protein product [Priceomyces carsonii]
MDFSSDGAAESNLYDFNDSPFTREFKKSSYPSSKDPFMFNLLFQDTNASVEGLPSSFNDKSRPHRPCDYCRRRKVKCVFENNKSICVRCNTRDMACTFNDPPRLTTDLTKGRSNSHSRKKLLDEPSNNTVSVARSPESLYKESKLNVTPTSNLILREGLPLDDYSKVLNSLLLKTLSLHYLKSSYYAGSSSFLFDKTVLKLIIEYREPSTNLKATDDHEHFDQVNFGKALDLRKASPRDYFLLIKDHQNPSMNSKRFEDIDYVEKTVFPNGLALINLYFRIIHPSYPILHKKVFLEKYSRTHREFSTPLLAAVYFLAIQWWDYDPNLQKQSKPDCHRILEIGMNSYVNDIVKNPKLSAVAAGLLLLQCTSFQTHYKNDRSDMGASETGGASYHSWNILSQIVAISDELGLGLDCDEWDLPAWEKGLRKRMAWGVYMADKWLAVVSGRPARINESNWIARPLNDEDFPERRGDGDKEEGSSDIDIGKLVFQKMIELSVILSEILERMYSYKAVRYAKDTEQILNLAKPLQLRLNCWYQSLCEELLITDVQLRKLCPNGSLHLAYFAGELSLHRQIITTIYEEDNKDSTLSEEIIEVCRSAARSRLVASIDFVKSLKAEHLQAFWYSTSSAEFCLIGTFATLLFVTSRSVEEEQFYKDQIFNYRWILKITSKGFEQTGNALEMLDTVLSRMKGIFENDN